MLETYRECLRDAFDVPGLKQILGEIERQSIRVHQVESPTPSPFASSLMFNYTANFLYQGDAPLAERRAAALALDHAQLRELLGTTDYRELLDPEAIDALLLELQRLDHRATNGPDAVHDLLLHLGDLNEEELAARCPADAVATGQLERWLTELTATRRIVRVRVAGERRYIAAEEAARYRDGLGVALPPGLPDAFLEANDDPLGNLVARYARTHGPFRAVEAASRFGLGEAAVAARIAATIAAQSPRRRRIPARRHGSRVVRRRRAASTQIKIARAAPQANRTSASRGARPLPAGVARNRTPATRARRIARRRRAIARRAAVGVRPRGADSAVPAHRLPPRRPGRTDHRGRSRLARHRKRRPERRPHRALSCRQPAAALPRSPRRSTLRWRMRVRELLATKGAIFFDDIAATLDGFRNDVLEALWQLVWNGEVTNDALSPLRSLRGATSASVSKSRSRRRGRRTFRSRRLARLPGSEGRWSLINYGDETKRTLTLRQTAITEQLLRRYGVLIRPAITRELVDGGFAALYPILRAMEETGRIRRGYFVAGMGGAQFASAGSDELLRRAPAIVEAHVDNVIVLAASDPANAYGSIVKWPPTQVDSLQPQRGSGARVFLLDGKLIGYLGRSGNHLLTFAPEDPSDAAMWHEKLVRSLANLAQRGAPS